MKTTPGIHPSCSFDHFTDEERSIIDSFAREWYITNTGERIYLGNSEYHYFLAKPCDYIANLINIDREIVVLFSDYEKFEPRTLAAITNIQNRYQKLRVERICSILVSKDPKIQVDLKELLKNDQEAQIIVPFCYGEFPDGPRDSYYFRNRLKAFFFSRDLFASESPIKSDLFFFGRRDLVQDLVSRHRSKQAAGIFGLRKTGKTSLIYGVQRSLKRDSAISVIIDCQNTAFNQKPWNLALRYVVSQIRDQNNVDERIKNESYYTKEHAAEVFEAQLRSMLSKLNAKSILLIFDEIENISFGVSPALHWREGLDFVFFWQTLRAVFQKPDTPMTYLVCGTNPLGIEQQTILNYDNPIYAQIPSDYIPRFNATQTRDLIRTLGRIMGLTFQEHLYSQINEDFGGHPYLIRQICSLIHKISSSERPVEITTKTYEKAKKKFSTEYAHFFEMILGVLRSFFPDEYDLLRLLACEEEEEFDKKSASNPMLLNHLLGYGIIAHGADGYYFRINALKEYVSGKERYRKKKLSHEERWLEVCERRNSLEIQLRKIIKNQLIMFYGKGDARDKVMSILSNKQSAKNLEYKDLFDPNKNNIYFSDLIKLLRKEWDLFQSFFGTNKDKLLRYLEIINELRNDAHAKKISEEEFQMFRLSIAHFETALEDYE